jgi:hypothetical protein
MGNSIIVWITQQMNQKKNEMWFVAKNDNGKLVATNASLETLEKSLDSLFIYNWIGYVDYV